jgi:FtsP/CotA-like multicopper oxidase with cupredoxin domain
MSSVADMVIEAKAGFPRSLVYEFPPRNTTFICSSSGVSSRSSKMTIHLIAAASLNPTRASMRLLSIFALGTMGLCLCCVPASASTHNAGNDLKEVCPRPPIGSVVPEPEDLRSINGVLRAEFTYRSFRAANGQMHYCYSYKDGSQAPTLRLHPGDWLILTLKNDLKPPTEYSNHDSATGASMPGISAPMSVKEPCAGAKMTAWSTNLHFHGLTVPPVCHQDDVLRTVIEPGGPPFEYRLRIPADEPPGVYWYHPHVHGFSNPQVLGGASGALIVEGIERTDVFLSGMPERLLIIRDQELLNPDAPPAKSSVEVPVLRDPEGDVLNMNTGTGKPAKDLSLNFVPVPYPDYPPSIIEMKPGERELWRILNASAITYVDLQILAGGAPLPIGVVSLDGVPIDESGKAASPVLWETNFLLPPAGRVDFIFKGPPQGTQASLVTRSVDTGPAGENDPVRPLANIVARSDAPEPPSSLPVSSAAPKAQTAAWLGDIKPARVRKLYFSERPSDPNNPNSRTVFMITVDGQKAIPYDPKSAVPNIVVRQGDVEDWIIENRTRELHAFHIHQIHFLVEEWNGVPIDEPYLRDTVNVPYWRGQPGTPYPSVKLRMDFRDPNAVGTFVYHCHLLEHEDGGMMGTIRVEPAR